MLHYAGCFTSARRSTSRVFGFVASLFVVAGLGIAAQSQTYTVIHNFTGGQDGGQPAAGPTLDRAGNLYGTAFSGGNQSGCASGCGVVYKLTHHNSSWLVSPLYSFTGAGDGSLPDYGAVTLGPDGTPYGTTSAGGLDESGTVFNVRPHPTACPSLICPWTETTVHQFGTGDDGYQPLGSVVFDAAGNLYGTTFLGGASGNGAVFEATRSGQNWTENVIYSFAGSSDGANPVAGLIFDSAGNLYGTTYSGGANGWGTVFELSPSGSGWTKTILYNFQNANDGRAPNGGVIFDQAGNLYGATSRGGTNSGGAVYQLSPSAGSWTPTILYSFSGVAGPYNTLTFDTNGNLYGTTYRDGADLAGSVFKLSQSGGNWTFTDLYDFTGANDGGYPTSSVAVDANGNVYGTASSGGSSGQGVAFEITP